MSSQLNYAKDLVNFHVNLTVSELNTSWKYNIYFPIWNVSMHIFKRIPMQGQTQIEGLACFVIPI